MSTTFNSIKRGLLEAIEHAQGRAHILEQAGIVFDAAVEPGKLRVVAGCLHLVTLRDTIAHD